MDYLKELKFALSSSKLNVLIEKMHWTATDQCCVKKINCVTKYSAKNDRQEVHILGRVRCGVKGGGGQASAIDNLNVSY